MSSPMGDLLALLGIALLGLLIWAALSPFEALGWWAGWFGDKIYEDEEPAAVPVVYNRQEDASAYVVFLSGIARVSGETMSRREQNFLHMLASTMPGVVVIDNVFPYSVNNLPLTAFFCRPMAVGIASQIEQTLVRTAGRLSDQCTQSMAGRDLGRQPLWANLQSGHRPGDYRPTVALRLRSRKKPADHPHRLQWSGANRVGRLDLCERRGERSHFCDLVRRNFWQ
jgi:hypothetical protein